VKNRFIAIFLSAMVALGALYLYRQKQITDLQAQLTAVQIQLVEKAEPEGKETRAEQKLKAIHDALINAQDALENTSKITINKTKLAGELAQSLAAGRTNNGNPLAAMMNDPKMRELMVSQQKAMFGPLLAKQYADFFKWLDLAPEQSATLIELMQMKRLAGADARMSLFGGHADDAQRANVAKQVKSDKDEYDAQIKQFLGDENYQSFQEYEKTIPSRTTVNLFSERLAGGATPLDADQQQQLIQVMTEERTGFPWTTDANQLVNNSGSARGNFSARLTDDKIEQSAQEQEQFDQQFLVRVRQILAPEQAAAFEQFQATQRKMLTSSMKLAAKMLAPSVQ
jgi:hypothetical protein